MSTPDPVDELALTRQLLDVLKDAPASASERAALDEAARKADEWHAFREDARTLQARLGETGSGHDEVQAIAYETLWLLDRKQHLTQPLCLPTGPD
jgi:hypothetical protein